MLVRALSFGERWLAWWALTLGGRALVRDLLGTGVTLVGMLTGLEISATDIDGEALLTSIDGDINIERCDCDI